MHLSRLAGYRNLRGLPWYRIVWLSYAQVVTLTMRSYSPVECSKLCTMHTRQSVMVADCISTGV
jgi:hypothetical protein